jgi:hypothetical protein
LPLPGEQTGLQAEPEVPRYVVWRIKPGTAAGALAPRLERRLRTEMETRLRGEVLSKAAQTGIILIRPELADCDGGLPCALDVAEALSIRFVVGGEAEVVSGQARVTVWMIDLDRRAETRRAGFSGVLLDEEAERGVMGRLTAELLMPPSLAGLEQNSAVPVARSFNMRPVAGGVLVAAGAVAAALSALGGLLGGAVFLSGAGFAQLKARYHTQAAANAMVSTLVGGVLLCAGGAVLLAAALPLGAVGVMTWAGFP